MVHDNCPDARHVFEYADCMLEWRVAAAGRRGKLHVVAIGRAEWRRTNHCAVDCIECCLALIERSSQHLVHFLCLLGDGTAGPVCNGRDPRTRSGM